MKCEHKIGVDAGEHDPTSCDLEAGHAGDHAGTIAGSDWIGEDYLESREVAARITWPSG